MIMKKKYLLISCFLLILIFGIYESFGVREKFQKSFSCQNKNEEYSLSWPYVKEDIKSIKDVDEYEDFLYYGDEYDKCVTEIDISGTRIDYLDDLSKYPNLERIRVDRTNNIDEIPDFSKASNKLKYMEFGYGFGGSDKGEKELFSVETISNLETIPEDVIENGFEIRLNVCGIKDITSESKKVIQKHPNIIFVELSNAYSADGGEASKCADDYYNLAGVQW